MDSKRQELEAYIEGHLFRRNYADKTREAYVYWVMRFCDFFDKYLITDFTIRDIEAFINDIEDRHGLSPSTTNQATNALHFYFNTLGKCKFEIKSLRRQVISRAPQYVPSQTEVLEILKTIPSKGTRLAVTLLYAAGLDLEEVINLRKVDINFERNSIRVPFKRSQGFRNAVLAEYIKPELYSYIRDTNSKKWVFEVSNGNHISASAIQKSISKAVNILDFKHSVTPKSLRYAYVKHLEKIGVNLLNILDELGISHRSSYEYYAELSRKKENVSISPIDRKIPSEAKTPAKHSNESYISEQRLNELSELQHSKYDLTKLLELLREINISNRHHMYLSVAILVRAVLDHIPPILDCKNFAEVSNNYKGGTSFKKQMLHMQNSFRNIADSHLHQQIRKSEVLPTFNQVNFKADLDVLLSEIVRISK